MSDKQFSKITDILQSSSFSHVNSTTNQTNQTHNTTPQPPQPHQPHQTSQTTEQPNPPTHTQLEDALIQLNHHINTVLSLINNPDQPNNQHQPTSPPTTHQQNIHSIEPQSGTVVEGVFDGKHMIAADGNQYFVAPTFAAETKLIEGDMLKLTITALGAYIYKLTSATLRTTTTGIITYNEQTQSYTAQSQDQSYNISKHAVSLYHLQPGNSVSLIIPKDSPSSWATIDNVLS